MIKSLHVSNFQAHRDTTIELCSGLNAFIGETDKGKTTILRALIWLLTNKPGGNAFTSHWGGTSLVEGHFETGINAFRVIRSRGKSQNIYKLDGMVLKAFGQGVPEEIARAVNIGPINIQTEHEPPFLLLNSPGEVARYLNKTINLTIIDKSVAAAKQKVTFVVGEIERLQKRKKTLSKKVKELLWLDEANSRLQEVERLSGILAGLMSGKTDLERTVPIVKRHNEILEKVRGIVVHKDTVIRIEELTNKRQKLVQRQSDIDSLLTGIGVFEQVQNKNQKIIGHAQKTKEIESLLEQRKALLNVKLKLEETTVDIKDLEDTISEQTETVNTKKQEFAALMPDVCPLCGKGN